MDRSTDLASGCFCYSSSWCRSLLLSFSTCYLGILGLEVLRGLKIAYWLEPPTKGQPPKRGQNLCSESVLYSEVPLYVLTRPLFCLHLFTNLSAE